MKQVFLLISLIFAHQAFAVCSSPIARTNFSANQVLTSTRLNADFNAAYTRANELPGDCITSESITTTQIDDGTILNADISASAAIAMSKTNMAIAILTETAAFGDESGTCSTGGYNVRALNNETDNDGIVSGLSGGNFSLAAGTYYVEASAMAYYVDTHFVDFVNVTDSVAVIHGSQAHSPAISGSNATSSTLSGLFTIATTKTFALGHICETQKLTNGRGIKNGVSPYVSLFSFLKITRIK